MTKLLIFFCNPFNFVVIYVDNQRCLNLGNCIARVLLMTESVAHQCRHYNCMHQIVQISSFYVIKHNFQSHVFFNQFIFNTLRIYTCINNKTATNLEIDQRKGAKERNKKTSQKEELFPRIWKPKQSSRRSDQMSQGSVQRGTCQLSANKLAKWTSWLLPSTRPHQQTGATGANHHLPPPHWTLLRSQKTPEKDGTCRDSTV